MKLRRPLAGALAAALLAGGAARGEDGAAPPPATATPPDAPSSPAAPTLSPRTYVSVRSGKVWEHRDASIALDLVLGRQLSRRVSVEIAAGRVRDAPSGREIFPATVSLRASLGTRVEWYAAAGAGLYAVTRTSVALVSTGLTADVSTFTRPGLRVAVGLNVPATSSVFAGVEASAFTVPSLQRDGYGAVVLQVGVGYRI
jgi:hypothetical protein